MKPNDPDKTPRLSGFTVQEVAELCSRSPSWVRNQIVGRRLTPARDARRFLLTEDHLRLLRSAGARQPKRRKPHLYLIVDNT